LLLPAQEFADPFSEDGWRGLRRQTTDAFSGSTPANGFTMLRPVLSAVVLATICFVGGCTEDDPIELSCNAGDQDCDGVVDAADVLPGLPDNGDFDGDGVTNRLDKWPLLDDDTQDIDGDRIADYLDTFVGNNVGDDDGDGIINGLDPAPLTTTPVQPPADISESDLTDLLLEQQMRQAALQDLAEFDQDGDLDGISDGTDITPDWYTNDGDGDGEVDFHDPEPNDEFVDSSNDPWDPSTDAYWELE